MKKGESRKRVRVAKGRTAARNVEEYLTAIPESARGTFTRLRATVRAAAPKDATETISYQIPALRHNGILVWYAAFSKHCSLFPTASVITAFKDELKDYSTSKGTVHFPIDQPLPTRLIKRMVKARVRDRESKGPSTPRSKL